MALHADIVRELALLFDEIGIFLIELTVRAFNLGFVFRLQFVEVCFYKIIFR